MHKLQQHTTLSNKRFSLLDTVCNILSVNTEITVSKGKVCPRTGHKDPEGE